MVQYRLFGEEERLARITELGDPLVRLNKAIDWEMFRPLLDAAFAREPLGPGGRPAFDRIMMFKILVIQRHDRLSDDRMEVMITDRLSFQRFLGLGMNDKVPDAKTIWKFRDDLTQAGVMKRIFDAFTEHLFRRGLVVHDGIIVDATFVEAPVQRNTKEENRQIKEGKIPEEWKKEENKHKLSQKDVDARWTKKGSRSCFGYKDHVKADRGTKYILDHAVTDASVHDSRVAICLVDERDKEAYMDSAYWGKEIREALLMKNPGLKLHVCERGTRGHPLTEEQIASNREISKIRCRVEHAFGFQTNSMNGIVVRSIGLARAAASMDLGDLVYNLYRHEHLTRPGRGAAS